MPPLAKAYFTPRLQSSVATLYCCILNRYLINSVKIGRGYFHTLKRETAEWKTAQKKERQKEEERWKAEFQPPRYPSSSSSDEGSSDEEITEYVFRKMIRPFTPFYNGLLSQKHPDAHFYSIFRQLCALTWLLEALTLEPNSSMKPVITCWNPRKAPPKSTLSMTKLDGLSSPHSKTTLTSTSSLTPASDEAVQLPSDSAKDAEEMDSSYSKQTKEEEEPLSYCESSRAPHCKPGGSEPRDPGQQQGQPQGECPRAPGAHGATLAALECLCLLAGSGNMLQVVRTRRLKSCFFCSRFSTLMERIPDEVKKDHRTQKVLKKLERFARNPDLRIRPPTFLKVLGELRIWEICSPCISAAVEFLREYIVEMPEEDYKEWLQSRVPISKQRARRAGKDPFVCCDQPLLPKV
uniref:Coiled-coil domain containing 60 n=1 Tax=Varanus komodoensis TaxID=61221 RepID=A0A8D2JF57_VARKO